MRYLITILLALMSVIVYGQKERKYIREGNGYYDKALSDTSKVDTEKLESAVVAYSKALEKKPGDFKALFNTGAAQFKQEKYEDAERQFQKALESAQTKEEIANCYFNRGDALLGQQKFDESIEAFKNALRNKPDDMEAKYNLEFARKMKEQKDQQQQQQDQNKDQQDQNKDQQDQNKDQQDQNKDQQDQNKDQQDQNKDQQDQNKDQQNQESQPQPKISQQAAEQMLNALDNDEKETQDKVNKAKAEKAKAYRIDKNW